MNQACAVFATVGSNHVNLASCQQVPPMERFRKRGFAGARNRQNLPSGGWPHESYPGRFLAQHWLQMALSGRLAAKSSWPPPVEDGELSDRGSESRPLSAPDPSSQGMGRYVTNAIPRITTNGPFQ
jgi:hypothetical protein